MSKRASASSRKQQAPQGHVGPAAAPVILVVLALTALLGAAFIVLRPAARASGNDAQSALPATELTGAGAPEQALARRPVVTAENGVVRLALAGISDGKAHFYTFQGSGKAIPFFVLKSSDGVIRAAFDACDVCFPARKGYHQEGDEMVCNNCGTRFPSTSINDVRGGCNPAPLERQIEGDSLIIKASDILAGARYF